MIQIPPELEGEYIIRVMDMPECFNGMVKYDENDFANVYVNAKLNAEARQKAADHELTHIINDDLHNDDDIRTIEARANQKPSPLGKVSALALTDEVAAKLLSIPNLIRARDLLPSTQLPHRSGEVAERSEVDRASRSPAIQLSPHQARLILNALSDLDRSFFRSSPYDI